MRITARTIAIQSAVLVAVIRAVTAQLSGHSVGDEICVVGYVMDDYCIVLGTHVTG